MDEATRRKLKDELRADEGIRAYPYDDKTGLRVSELPSGGKLTIGVGWNLSDRPLPETVIEALLDIAIEEAEVAAQAIFPRFEGWTSSRKRAVLNMLYNLGKGRFLTFKRMVAAMRAGKWSEASAEALASRWAQQVGPGRSGRIAKQLKEG